MPDRGSETRERALTEGVGAGYASQPLRSSKQGEDESHASPSPRHSVSASGPHLLTKPTLREQSGDIIMEEAHALEPPNGQTRHLPAATPPLEVPRASVALTGVAVASRASPPGCSDHAAVVRPMPQAFPSRATNNTSEWPAPLTGGSRAAEGLPLDLPGHSRQRLSATQSDLVPSESSISSKAYRSLLTHENLESVAQAERSHARVDPGERIWAWLALAGPPFDVDPSVGVNSKPGGPIAAAPSQKEMRNPHNQQPSGVSRWCGWCFCFGSAKA